MIKTDRGKRLAPLYDNPCSMIWTQASREPLMHDCLVELDRLKMKNIVTDFFNSIDVKKNVAVITSSRALSNLMQEALLKLVQQRIQELEDYVSHS